MKRCPKCGKSFPDEANFCPTDAGRLVADAAPPKPKRAQTAEGVLAGRFELGEVVSELSIGDVYDATDNTTNVVCRVTFVVPAVFKSPSALQRTERELKQLEKVRADGVVRILGHGRTGDQLWFATERVAGTTLAHLVASQGALAPERAQKIVLAIGHALAEVAKLGVMHRDLSPNNVIIDGEAVRLINFGVVTPGDKVSGVVEFASPEQIEGKPVDQRSNIYTLGVLYHYLLCGKPPYSGTADEVIKHHLEGAAPAITGTNPNISSETEALILKCLARSSSKRFMTLRQMLGEVEKTPLTRTADAGQTLPMGRAGAASPPAAAAKPTNQTIMGGFQVPAGGLPATPAASALDSSAVAATVGGTADAAPKAAAVSLAPPLSAVGSNATGGASPSSRVTAQGPAVSGPTGGANGAATQPTPAIEAPTQDSPSAPPARVESAPPARVESAPPARAESAPAPAVAVAAAPAVATAQKPAAVVSKPAPAPNAASASGSMSRSKRPSAAKGGGKGKKRRKKKQQRKGKFRETMWFKKGELDAAAAQHAATKAARGEAPVPDKADLMPMEDRYSDDGTLTDDDAKFSLKTGSTQMMRAITGDELGEKVSEEDLIGELKGGRGKIFAAIGAGVVLLIGAIVYFAL